MAEERITFLQQLEALRRKTPRLFNINIGSENSDYCTHSDKNKNCYLLFAANYNQDCMYGRLIYRNRFVVDCDFTQDSELCYDCIDCRKSYNCLFSDSCEESTDLIFCFNLRNCQNCIFSTNLRNQNYHIFNKPVSKEEAEDFKTQMLKLTQNADGLFIVFGAPGNILNQIKELDIRDVTISIITENFLKSDGVTP